jgi:hypothetical protein
MCFLEVFLDLLETFSAGGFAGADAWLELESGMDWARAQPDATEQLKTEEIISRKSDCRKTVADTFFNYLLNLGFLNEEYLL